jgi:hypothetical protein
VSHQRIPDSEVPTLNLGQEVFCRFFKTTFGRRSYRQMQRDTYRVVRAKYSRLMIFVYENEGGFLIRADQEENIGKS